MVRKMIYGIGTDIVEVDRVIQAIQRNDRFLERYYTEKERQMFQEHGQLERRAALNFAGKEAVAKALGTGINGTVRLEQIEILRRETGAPFVALHGSTAQYAREQDIREIHISLSDTDQTAIAYVIACVKSISKLAINAD